MSIEILLYAYLFVCCGMIVFNIVTAIFLKRRDRRTLRVSRRFRQQVMRQMEALRSGECVSERHKKYLAHKLSRIGNMLAFDETMERLYREERDRIESYLRQLDGVIVYLSYQYGKKERIEAAFFPYIVKKYRLIENMPFSGVTAAMMDLLDEPSIYCRENAMQAIYTTGDHECVIKALKRIDNGAFFHEKLLVDGLLTFTGDHSALCGGLAREISTFSVYMQVAIVNFLRLDTDAYQSFCFDLLRNTETDSEVRYACIRYLGRYPYSPARSYLLMLASSGGEADWEYAAIASTALSGYPGEETVACLKRNLYSRNWYIRYNASQSLERLGLTYLDLIDVMEGQDRYAMEILRYRFDIQDIAKKGVPHHV